MQAAVVTNAYLIELKNAIIVDFSVKIWKFVILPVNPLNEIPSVSTNIKKIINITGNTAKIYKNQIYVATEEEAIRICENWEKKADELYTMSILQLME